MKNRQVSLIALIAASLLALAAAVGVGQAATQVAPVNTAPPTITGTTTVGQTLTASDGTWSNTPTTFAYQWLRCNGGGNSCASVANGTQKMYTLVGADAGHTMRVRVTATNADGSDSAQSAQSETVARCDLEQRTAGDRPSDHLRHAPRRPDTDNRRRKLDR